MKYLARFILKLAGWSFEDIVPTDKKAIILAAPHTSNWDFVIGKIYFIALGIPVSVMVKKSFFCFPLRYLMRAIHAIPVDRKSKNSVFIDNIVKEFNSKDTIYLCIAPEGSRKKRKKWKKGFLVIAEATNVPIYIGRIDYKKKHSTIGPRYELSGDFDTDMNYIMSTYKDANAKFPEKFSCEN